MAKQVKTVKKKKVGRPTIYTEDMADALFQAISTSENSLKVICSRPGMPGLKTVMTWLRTNEKFQQSYARAKQEQADVIADQIIAIADSTLIGVVVKETKDGKFEEIGDNVQRSRLMIDARKWVAAKLKPSKYGEKLDVTSDGKTLPSAAPVVTNIIIENPHKTDG